VKEEVEKVLAGTLHGFDHLHSPISNLPPADRPHSELWERRARMLLQSAGNAPLYLDARGAVKGRKLTSTPS